MEIRENETKEANITGRINDRLFTKGDRVAEQYLHGYNNENTINQTLCEGKESGKVGIEWDRNQ